MKTYNFSLIKADSKSPLEAVAARLKEAGEHGYHVVGVVESGGFIIWTLQKDMGK